MNYEQALETTSKLVPDLQAFYLFGSRVYGTASPSSDWDFIAVSPSIDKTLYFHNDPSLGFDVTIYSDRMFQALVAGHDISALECLWLPPEHQLLSAEWDWRLHLPTLRESISRKVSHSWVKAKKLLTVEHELDRAQKSLFHSFRIGTYGIQIATFGSITDYQAANAVLDEVRGLEPNWELWSETFKQRNNQLLTEFRTHAPRTQ